jgi:hypothetical protein
LSLYLLRGKPPETYWRLARWAPIIFVPIFGVALVTSGLLINPASAISDARILPALTAIYALYVLPVGYFYVLLAWLGYQSLEQRG